jgi:hypothetical protein
LLAVALLAVRLLAVRLLAVALIIVRTRHDKAGKGCGEVGSVVKLGMSTLSTSDDVLV